MRYFSFSVAIQHVEVRFTVKDSFYMKHSLYTSQGTYLGHVPQDEGTGEAPGLAGGIIFPS